VEPLGRRIAHERSRLGWTQARLAERIAVSRVALSHLEAGMSVANERTVVLLAGTFGLDPYELVAGTDYPPAKAVRLPLVATRHTETDLQLALLAADLTWIDELDDWIDELDDNGAARVARLATARLTAWSVRLGELLAELVDPTERQRATAAHQALAPRIARQRTRGGGPAGDGAGRGAPVGDGADAVA
jgi:transcriptional regulator with XRE-family HTH domain